jgi:hypothetical protein
MGALGQDKETIIEGGQPKPVHKAGRALVDKVVAAVVRADLVRQTVDLEGQHMGAVVLAGL